MKFPDGTGSTYNFCDANDGMFYNDSAIRIRDVFDSITTPRVVSQNRAERTRWFAGESQGMNLHSPDSSVWTPNSNQSDPWKANSFHPGGVPGILWTDRSFRSLTRSI